MPGKPAELSLSIQYPAGKAGAPTRAQVRRWVRASLGSTLGGAEIAVRFVDAEEGRQLNLGYRGKDYATNVLSFAYSESAPLQGDLAVCLPVVAAEASAQGKTLDAHHAHLIVHGMLHLQGYDHETGAADAAAMERRECEILAQLGFPNPYE